MEFREGKVESCTRCNIFADPFEASTWRSQWVQQNGDAAGTKQVVVCVVDLDNANKPMRKRREA